MNGERCWWCGEPWVLEDLIQLEGARLVGSRPLSLSRIPADERTRILVDRECAIMFADLRRRHDIELAEAALEPGGSSGPERNVRALVRRANGEDEHPGRTI